ncbi:MAG: hypothetical protein AMXMBFR34_32570 [Myxococcaceae bacterium]
MARSWVSRLWPAALFQFCFIGAVSMMKPGATALMLARFQESALPWLYMAAAVVTGALALLRLGRKSDPGFVSFAAGLFALTLAAGLWFNLPFFRLGAYLFAEAFATLVSLAFWSSLTDAFDAREARRAFTWVNGIGMSGAIVGGFSAQVLSRSVGALGRWWRGACCWWWGPSPGASTAATWSRLQRRRTRRARRSRTWCWAGTPA